MEALDSFGLPAYSCATDGTHLVPVDDAQGVLQCPTCGHRTDEPGTGVLGDGFDVTHRQWGLRGDPHVWAALRTAVEREPTPADEAGVRAAYEGALRDVALVDVSAVDRGGDLGPVRREEFAHGGMSSGTVDTGWWREKGVPLLVERAVSRRPSGRRSRASSLLTTLVVWLVVGMIPAATIGGGGWLLHQRATGTQVEATVLSCDTTGNFRRYGPDIRTDCVARWTVDGRTVVGNYDVGHGESDVGRTVDATVRGDTAYSRSLVLPIILIALGLPFLLILGIAARHASRNRRSRG